MRASSKRLSPELIEQLLVAKSILERVRTQMPSAPDRHTVATNVLLAHDAAELVLAAIANHLGTRSGDKNKIFLMNYFEPIQKKRHPRTEVEGKRFFSQLNDARNGFKHNGNFPDTAQFARVGDRTYEYVKGWCEKYAGLALDELDYSVLLRDEQVKNAYKEAEALFAQTKYKELLERLAIALHGFVARQPGLQDISIGVAKAEDAIKLAAFGVHSNDFLTLQQFLPRAVYRPQEEPEIRWNQTPYGHPGNWDKVTAQFCLKTFLEVVIKLQSASWIPTPVHFTLLYEHKIEIVEDDVPIYNLPEGKGPYTVTPDGNVINRGVIENLTKGTILFGTAELETSQLVLAALQGRQAEKADFLIMTRRPRQIYGYVAKSHVKVTCVPRDDDFVKQNFPYLTEIPWQGSN